MAWSLRWPTSIAGHGQGIECDHDHATWIGAGPAPGQLSNGPGLRGLAMARGVASPPFPRAADPVGVRGIRPELNGRGDMGLFDLRE